MAVVMLLLLLLGRRGYVWEPGTTVVQTLLGSADVVLCVKVVPGFMNVVNI